MGRVFLSYGTVGKDQALGPVRDEGKDMQRWNGIGSRRPASRPCYVMDGMSELLGERHPMGCLLGCQAHVLRACCILRALDRCVP